MTRNFSFKKRKFVVLPMPLPYTHAHYLNYKEAAHKLSNDAHITLNWFKVNSMVANPGKFQVMLLGLKIDNSKIIFAIENKQIKWKGEVKLLEITIHQKLTFTKHIANTCSLD